MPCYFFKLFNGYDIPDSVSIDLVDLSAARIEAIRYSGEVLKGDPSVFWTRHAWRIEVTNDTGHSLFAVHTSAMDVSGLEAGHRESDVAQDPTLGLTLSDRAITALTSTMPHARLELSKQAGVDC